MSKLPPPATGVELFLAAILEELRAIRVALGDGGQGLDSRFVSTVPVADDPFTPSVAGAEQTFTAAEVRAVSGPALAKAVGATPTKRTRSRAR